MSILLYHFNTAKFALVKLNIFIAPSNSLLEVHCYHNGTKTEKATNADCEVIGQTPINCYANLINVSDKHQFLELSAEIKPSIDENIRVFVREITQFEHLDESNSILIPKLEPTIVESEYNDDAIIYQDVQKINDIHQLISKPWIFNNIKHLNGIDKSLIYDVVTDQCYNKNCYYCGLGEKFDWTKIRSYRVSTKS